MRYLVLTDIHGNLEALEAALSDAARRGYDQTLILGDLVGYGADPNAVIERAIALKPVAIVRGNHDKVAAGLDQAEGFNAVAKAAAEWTVGELTPEHRAWVAALPRGPLAVDDLIEICHGSPFDEDTYIFDETDALRALRASSRPVCLFGHTHTPAAFSLDDQMLDHLPTTNGPEVRLAIADGVKYLVNPGAVGQPRDGNPRAAYAIVDTQVKTIDLIRVEYDIQGAQEKVVDAGLPDVLARRLASGR